MSSWGRKKKWNIIFYWIKRKKKKANDNGLDNFQKYQREICMGDSKRKFSLSLSSETVSCCGSLKLLLFFRLCIHNMSFDVPAFFLWRTMLQKNVNERIITMTQTVWCWRASEFCAAWVFCGLSAWFYILSYWRDAQIFSLISNASQQNFLHLKKYLWSWARDSLNLSAV